MRLIAWEFLIVLGLLQESGGAAVIEDAQVNWTNSTNPSSEQDSHPSLPDNVVLTLTIGNETIELNLNKKQDDDFEEIPVIVGNTETVKTWHHSKNEEFSVYSDESKDATLSVVVKTENGTVVTEYYGSFVHKDIKYSLTPKSYQDKFRKTSKMTYNVSLNGTQYLVYEDQSETVAEQDKPVNDVLKRTDPEEENITNGKTEKGPTFSDIFVKDEVDQVTVANVPEVDLDSNLESNTTNFNLPKRSSRRKREESMELLVDLMVVIDNSMYRRWLKLNSYYKDRTIERLRYYIAHIINGVNIVYKSMKSYRLSVAVVGIFIAETADQSSYFKDPKVKIYQDDEKVNFTKALLDFGKWVSKRKPKEGELETEEIFLQEHDIAIAFTDYHEGFTKGLAILGSVCEDLAQGIVHSRGHYNTISTAAHEIGHVLGCEHDGDGSNDCNPADHYLMSPMMNFNKIDNWHKLSNCSIAEIVENVEKLEWNGRNCLDSSKKHRKTEDLDKLLNSYPGVHFGPDEQCQLKFGDGYKFCSQGIDTNICNQMSCLNTEDNTCYKGYPIASDGTACGKGKWCINGNCVFGAPIKPGEKETCYFGDKSDIFLINGVPKRCNDVLNEPRLCYQVDEWCCETCEKIKSDKNISLATCAYGDKGIVFNVGSRKYGCELVFRRPDICLEPEDAEHCCESCLKVNKNSNLPGTSVDTPTDECEDDHSVIYNNIEITCASLLHDPAKCYGLEKYCCKTCAEVKIRKDINIPNCPYGDRGMIITVGNKRYGCELVYKRPDLCEKSKYEINCCESCDKAKKAASTPEAPGIDVEKPEEICKDNKNLVLENGEKFNCVSLLLYPGKCYQLNKYCCQTCATIQRANDYRLGPNCPYGDYDVKLEFNYKEYSCPALVRWYPQTCSDPQAAHYCCESCFRVNRN